MNSSLDLRHPVCPDCGMRRSTSAVPCTFCRSGIEGATPVNDPFSPSTLTQREPFRDPFWIVLVGLTVTASLCYLLRYSWLLLFLPYLVMVLALVRVQGLIAYCDKVDRVMRVRDWPIAFFGSVGVIVIITVSMISSAAITWYAVAEGGYFLLTREGGQAGEWLGALLWAGLLAAMGVGTYVAIVVGRWLSPGNKETS